MKYFNYLDYDHIKLSQSLLKYAMSNPSIYNPRSYNWRTIDQTDVIRNVPEIQTFMEYYGCEFKHGAFFVTWRPSSGQIHHDDYPAPARFIVPVLNCENTETIFYKTKRSALPHHNGLVPLFLYNDEDCIPVDSYKLIKPVVLRIHEPHRVILHSENYPRISFTFSANKDITHLLGE